MRDGLKRVAQPVEMALHISSRQERRGLGSCQEREVVLLATLWDGGIAPGIAPRNRKSRLREVEDLPHIRRQSREASPESLIRDESQYAMNCLYAMNRNTR